MTLSRDRIKIPYFAIIFISNHSPLRLDGGNGILVVFDLGMLACGKWNTNRIDQTYVPGHILFVPSVVLFSTESSLLPDFARLVVVVHVE